MPPIGKHLFIFFTNTLNIPLDRKQSNNVTTLRKEGIGTQNFNKLTETRIKKGDKALKKLREEKTKDIVINKS